MPDRDKIQSIIGEATARLLAEYGTYKPRPRYPQAKDVVPFTNPRPADVCPYIIIPQLRKGGNRRYKP